MNKILIFYALINCLGAHASLQKKWNCSESELRYDGKTVSGAGYCYRPEPYHLLSENCLDGECALLKSIRKAKDSDFDVKFSPIGNPGFKLCRRLGGNARSIEFRAEGKWRTFNECRLIQDQSFANVDFLLYMARRERPWL